MVATSVARRVHEMGVRSSLGARPRQLVTAIVLEHLRPSAAGAMLGLIASWWTSQLVRRFLYEVDPHEPVVWIVATATLLLVAAGAAWIPARRASRVDPMIVLRAE
jgi:ABC-type antimicrobial peptide transport system permease subunit